MQRGTVQWQCTTSDLFPVINEIFAVGAAVVNQERYISRCVPSNERQKTL